MDALPPELPEPRKPAFRRRAALLFVLLAGTVLFGLKEQLREALGHLWYGGPAWRAYDPRWPGVWRPHAARLPVVTLGPLGRRQATPLGLPDRYSTRGAVRLPGTEHHDVVFQFAAVEVINDEELRFLIRNADGVDEQYVLAWQADDTADLYRQTVFPGGHEQRRLEEALPWQPATLVPTDEKSAREFVARLQRQPR